MTRKRETKKEKKCFVVFFFFFFFFFFRSFFLFPLCLLSFRKGCIFCLSLVWLTIHFVLRSCRVGVAADLERVHAMIVALAVFEKEPFGVKTTVESMARDFGNGCFGFFVWESHNGVQGFALYHWRYSTWTGRCLFLEDLFVEESVRNRGAGRDLFMCCVKLAAEQDAARLQWQVLNWNEKALGFYRKFDPEITDEWLNCKLVREQLRKLSNEEGGK